MKFSGLLFIIFLLASGCNNKEGKNESYSSTSYDSSYNKEEAHNIEESPKSVVPFENPEDNYLLAEQAVDAWLYFHLSDYKTYQPLIRSTDYDTTRNIYIHHLRLRRMNPEGGMFTSEHTFEVDMTRKGDNGNPFHVVEVK